MRKVDPQRGIKKKKKKKSIWDVFATFLVSWWLTQQSESPFQPHNQVVCTLIK